MLVTKKGKEVFITWPEIRVTSSCRSKWYLLSFSSPHMLGRVKFSTVENIHQEVLKGEFRSPDTAPGSSSGDRGVLGKDCVYTFTGRPG